MEATTIDNRASSFNADALSDWVREGGAGDAAGTRSRGAASAVPAVPAWVVDNRPPACNTGGKFPTLGIKVDALRVTVRAEHLDAVEALLTRYLGDVPDLLGHGFYTYQQAKRWPTGALLLWSEGRAECCVQMMGEDINTLDLAHVRPLFIDLGKLGAKGRRVDVALDDFSHDVLNITDVLEAGRARNVQGCRRWEPKEKYDVRSGQPLALGANFGVRGKDGSGRYVRFYRKDLESGGEVDCTRMELETAGMVAELLFDELSECEDDERFARKLRRVLAGCIDFRERGDEKNVDRMPRLPWWEKLVNILGETLRLVAHRPVSNLQKTAEYIRSAFGKTLALMRITLDSSGVLTLWELLEEWADEAEHKIDWRRIGGRSLALNVVELTG